MRVVLAAVIAIAAFAVPLARPASAASDPGAEHRFVDLVNRERTARRVKPLVLRDDVTDVARGWTSAMSSRGDLQHNPRLREEMPHDWRRIGENVGRGVSIDALHSAFMASDTHRANVLGDYSQLGVGAEWVGDTLWVTLDFLKSSSPPPRACSPPPPPSRGETDRNTTGYYVLGSDGGVFSFGNAPYLGSLPQRGVHAEAMLMSVSPTADGYWMLGRDGGVFAFGEAGFYGSVPGLGLESPVTAVDLAPTPTGKGYWILGADGGIFAFGDAVYFGGLPGSGTRNRGVRLLATATGEGYWILAADGGVFSFGDAVFHGSVPGLGIRAASVSMARTPSGSGYWILGRDGGIFSFGDATFHGSVPGMGLCDSVRTVEISPTVGGSGYYVLGDRGRVFAFGDAPELGDAAALQVAARDLVAGDF